MQLQPMVKENSQIVLDRELIEAIMEKSPTMHHSKVFSWAWEGNLLCIRHDAVLARHILNPNQQASWIALGCLVKAVEIAARAQGWKTEVLMYENVSAQISFLQGNKSLSDEIAIRSLLKRAAYQGPFRKSAVPHVDSRQTNGTGLHIVESSFINARFREYIQSTAAYIWLQTKLKSAPKIAVLAAKMPFLMQIFSYVSRRNLRNAHYILITASDTNPYNLMEAGRTAMMAWIELDIQGYSAQPCNAATLPLVATANGFLPVNTSEKFQKLVLTEGPDILKQQFNLQADQKPIWLLRVGQPEL